MSSSSLQSAIYLNDARAETLTNELTDNSMDLRLVQKHSSNEIAEIRQQYKPEKDRINNQIDSMDKVEQQEEYQDLLTELRELKEAEEQEVAKIEEKLSDQETLMQTENELLEVQLEDINAQTESFKEMLKENIEKNFGYFQ